jgi:hypothetical protein
MEHPSSSSDWGGLPGKGTTRGGFEPEDRPRPKGGLSQELETLRLATGVSVRLLTGLAYAIESRGPYVRQRRQ